MKLNPPASSSDLDLARAIARRLHNRARQPEGSGEEPTIPAPPSAVPEPPLSPPPEPAAFKPPDFEPPLPEAEAPRPPEPEPPIEPIPDGAEPDVTDPQPPAPKPEPATFAPPELEPPVMEEAPAPLPDEPPSELSTHEPAPPAEDSSPDDPWGVAPDDALSELTGSTEPSLEGLEPPDAPFAETPGGAISPEDLLAAPALQPHPDSPLAPEEPAVAGDDPGPAPDDLVATPGPPWDDVADACLALAQAHGAMLVDASGQVLTARGDWPEPGPDAIAGRLVSMMERTLQDAPTRSVSAPIAGQHLTAWRIPAGEGYLTVVFMGEAPLSADERPAIDDHIGEAVEGRSAV